MEANGTRKTNEWNKRPNQKEHEKEERENREERTRAAENGFTIIE